jgi:uncharacterized protein YjbI with pentapeptide repeats
MQSSFVCLIAARLEAAAPQLPPELIVLVAGWLGNDLALAHAALDGFDMSLLVLKNLRLPHAQLRGTNFLFSNLRGATLVGADLRGANLRYTILVGANLEAADLTGADLTGALLLGANLRGAILTDAICVNATLVKTSLVDAVHAGADWTGANFTDVFGGSFSAALNQAGAPEPRAVLAVLVARHQTACAEQAETKRRRLAPADSATAGPPA